MGNDKSVTRRADIFTYEYGDADVKTLSSASLGLKPKSVGSAQNSSPQISADDSGQTYQHQRHRCFWSHYCAASSFNLLNCALIWLGTGRAGNAPDGRDGRQVGRDGRQAGQWALARRAAVGVVGSGERARHCPTGISKS